MGLCPCLFKDPFSRQTPRCKNPFSDLYSHSRFYAASRLQFCILVNLHVGLGRAKHTSWWQFIVHDRQHCVLQHSRMQKCKYGSCPMCGIRNCLYFYCLSLTAKYLNLLLPFGTGLLKVVGNEKIGGSGVWLLLEYGTGPWRSMSVYIFMKLSSFLQSISVSCL
jgi:hypothetical protein